MDISRPRHELLGFRPNDWSQAPRRGTPGKGGQRLPGHSKVDQKVFLFQSPDETLEPSVSLKLPYSAHYALSLACSQPTSHGLGKSGWVTVRLDDPACPDSELLLDWLDESYRARAGRRRIATLDASPVRAAGPD